MLVAWYVGNGGVKALRDVRSRCPPLRRKILAKQTWEEKQEARAVARDKASARPAGDASFRGYVNVSLTDDQKSGYEAWGASAALWDAFDKQVGRGVHVSVKWEEKRDCFLASGTQRSATSPNAGLVVTARAADPATALGRLLYTLTFLDTAERWEDLQPMADPNRW
jgi:hypothetical protein